MVRIAIAGGTGGIGRHIVEALLATKKHSVVVLSRSISHPALSAQGAEIISVDYSNHASLVSALIGVHTVISTIWSWEPETMTTSQVALLNAAIEAGVKRFAPSEWSVIGKPNDPIELYRSKPPVAEAVAKSGMEYTLFENGIFMNYFATGTEGIGYLVKAKFIVDVEHCTARLPGTGDDKVGFTAADDIGKFVAASLELPKWPERSSMAGEILTYNDVVAIAEKIRGRKFEVTYISMEELEKVLQKDPQLSSQGQMEIARGRFAYKPNLNEILPDVKPMSVEEFLKKWWT
ncbi:hypothetical protein M422DRAFT_54518 [Sphaerobolus stellatus SS14]|uniref:NmrA-like domain-containing protein n=1 Tax=Sphaerobolus stellatus (strain SS14) TaxID=990650 RepID=A0A0C9UTH3_SPHS4|nr:hypothetical protein M422DRAFT_54518 [Sphaerobolus stellatus SS14]